MGGMKQVEKNIFEKKKKKKKTETILLISHNFY